ncbi:MAG: MFS transporter, partial [Alphaproteobacteria bacterium]
AINSTIFNLGHAVGPAIAGMLISPLGVASVFALNFLAFAAHLINLFRIHMAPPERRERGRAGMVGEFKEGLRYTLSHAGIAPVLVLLIISSVASRPVMDMMPGFADDVFGRGAEGFGWLLSAYGAGGVLAAVWLTQRGSVIGLTALVVVQTLLMGAAIIIFALMEFFWAGLALVTAFGFSHVISGTGTQTLMQTAVANQVRGRVMSLYAMVTLGMPAVGAIIIGGVAEHLGLHIATLGAGVICLIGWVWIRLRLKVMAPALETHPD